MQGKQIKKIVIVGGGTAGWMTAAALSKTLPKTVEITLIESEQIGTVGVGEATIPHIRDFNAMLGLNESEFLKATNATYKLGINFVSWGQTNSNYFHPFGNHGFEMGNRPFHHAWLAARENGQTFDFDNFSMANVAARHNKFSYPDPDPNSVLSTYSYAYHLDATLYAKFLRQYSESNGINRREGIVKQVHLHAQNGFIKAVELDGNQTIEADIFIDCSGFRSLLLGQSLNVEFDDWSEYLPCDRAVAVPSESAAASDGNDGEPLPYTQVFARDAGWQWRIPLQNRIGNGHVYSSRFMSDDEATKILMDNLPGEALAEPRVLKFKAGMREKSWHKNCVAIGLSSGFLEPLESTSIYLIQMSIYKLISFFPNKDFDPAYEQEFNRLVASEYKLIRDFLILHYKLANKDTSEFWRYCFDMPIPESLSYKMALFEQQAHVVEYEHGLFKAPSWLSVYFGQGFFPSLSAEQLSHYSAEQINQTLLNMQQVLTETVDTLPTHQRFLFNQNKVAGAKPNLSLYGGA